MAVITKDEWTGTRGIVSSDLTDDWETDKTILEHKPAPCNSLHIDPDRFGSKLWEFYQKNFPKEAKLVIERWLES